MILTYLVLSLGIISASLSCAARTLRSRILFLLLSLFLIAYGAFDFGVDFGHDTGYSIGWNEARAELAGMDGGTDAP